ncbi:MAG: type II secretion system F family protein [Planctomycetota bacterium]
MPATARLTGKRLADLCHRLAVSADAGIDTRRTWKREADNARGALAEAFTAVRDGVASGETLTDSLLKTRGVFPRLFLEMTRVGEQTGSLAEVMHRLSDHYQRGHEMRSELIARLRWPVLQLIAAVAIIGLLLVVFAGLGLQRLNGEPIDVLGLGVTGYGAVRLYVLMLVVAGGAVALSVAAVRRGWLWGKAVQQLAVRLPVVGPCVESICMARLTWALHLTLNTETDLRRLVPMVLHAAGNDHYTRWSKAITDRVAGGTPLHEAFASTGAFPTHLLDALQVAEESGMIVESMARLSQQYEQESQHAIAGLSTALAFVIGLTVMAAIGAAVIRLFQVVYLDMINDALNF